MAIGFGVFMGIVPIWGFQMLTAIALSIFFRLNKALVILAANISIPPMIPFIVYLSHKTGGFWMGSNKQDLLFSSDITLVMIQDSFLQYVYGSVTLAIVAGVIFGGSTYLTLKARRRSTAHGNG